MRAAHAAAGVLAALAAACSGPDETVALPATLAEQRALAEARAMVPAAELTPASEPEETPTP